MRTIRSRGSSFPGRIAEGFKQAVSGAAVRLFLLSLGVRLLFLFWVTFSFDEPVFDEMSYFRMALAYRTILTRLFVLELPSTETLHFAYNGWFPPLHPLLLSFGLLFARTMFFARLVPVVLSSLTSVLIFLIVSHGFNRRTAILASLIHIFYPSFIAYSHYLWSETTFGFFLLLTFGFTLLCVQGSQRTTRLIYAAVAGLTLGFSVLTRAAGLPYLLFYPLFVLGVLHKNDRFLASAILILVALVVVAPWQYTLYQNEGHPVVGSSAGSWNLYLGNNPLVPEGYGSAWGFSSIKEELRRRASRHAEKHSVKQAVAYRQRARDYIRRHPVAFVKNGLDRFRMLWAMDLFLLRHLFRCVYSPVVPWLALLIVASVALSYLLLVSLSLLGLASMGFRSLFAVLGLGTVVVGSLPPMFTVAVPRFHVPLLLFLLPYTAVALDRGIRSWTERSIGFSRLSIMVLLLVLFGVNFLGSLPLILEGLLLPSSYYRPVYQKLAPITSLEPRFRDHIVFRVSDPRINQLTYRIKRSGYVECSTSSDRGVWNRGTGDSYFSLKTCATSPDGPLVIQIQAGDGEPRTLRPVRRSSWKTWNPTGMDSVSYKWWGGAH